MSTPTLAGPRRTRQTVTTDDRADIAVCTDGDPNAPVTVLLCHGWTMSAHHWRPHIDALTRPRQGFPAVRVVSYDQRGHGRSTRGSAALDTALLGRDLDQVLDAAVPDDTPVIAVGHSMGGMAIQQLAARRPDLFGTRLAGVGLISTCLDEVAEWVTVPLDRPDATSVRRLERARQRIADGLLRSPRSARTVHRLLTGPLSHPNTAPLWRVAFGPGPQIDTVREVARALTGVPATAVAEFYAALTAHDCAGRLDALTRLPTRILVGALDWVTPPAQARRLAAEIPGAELQIVPGHGHDLPYERPALVVETVHALLREAPRHLSSATVALSGPAAR